MVKGAIVELNNSDMEAIAKIAHARNSVKERAGVRSNKFDASKGEEDAHLIGVMGEYAVAKYLGLKIDEVVTLHGDNGSDLNACNCIRIEVKTRNRRGFDFALNNTRTSDIKWDVGILAYKVASNQIEIAGWISKVSFLSRCTVKNYNYGDRLVVEPDKMFALTDLRNTIEKVTNLCLN
jgi:hypothetical protein